ncbi:MAG: 4-hydroxythreonine-4-phosphate dehydrogenase PdxA, partial [Candidatus Omnitrophica bacterium]|nr:4-hydroxythreonine-4-phosphate dehydrogenase PdxA [Candidatus Omnitrophota bacterium]
MHTSRSNKKKIVITMGDPSGVGPEVTLKALASPKIKGLADFLLIGDRAALDRTAGDMALKFKCELLDLANVPAASFKYGVQSPVFGKAAIGYLDAAIRLLRKGEADALVTAPVNKMSIRMAGIKKFEGHTEYLAEKTGSKNFAMMFVGGRLKITLVTRHIALRRVPGSLAVEPICRTICITHKYLREYFNIKDPRIGVSG